MSLKETLEGLKLAEEQRTKGQLDKPSLINEWQQAIIELYDSVQGFLSEYESLGLSFEREPMELSEEGLGAYAVHKLIIQAPSKTIVLTPIGRIIVGGTGRVDMHVRGKAFGDEKFKMIRRTNDKTKLSTWIISCPPKQAHSKKVIHIGPSDFMALDKEALEGAIDNLLR
jgi:hypothetical protein